MVNNPVVEGGEPVETVFPVGPDGSVGPVGGLVVLDGEEPDSPVVEED